MPYPKPKTSTFTLAELDPDSADLTVTMLDPESMPASTTSKIARAQTVFARAQQNGERTLSPEDQWALQAPQEMLETAVVEWNLPYPVGHPKAGQIVPLRDAQAEADPLGVIPSVVYAFILSRVMRRFMTPEPVNPASQRKVSKRKRSGS